MESNFLGEEEKEGIAEISQGKNRTQEQIELEVRSEITEADSLEEGGRWFFFAYEEEDEEMMIRLIKIRNSLWT